MPLASISTLNASTVPTAGSCLGTTHSSWRRDCLTARLTGTSCSPPSALRVDSPWRRETGGWRPSTITTTVSASTARCAKRTSRDRASTPREGVHFAKPTLANPLHVPTLRSASASPALYHPTLLADNSSNTSGGIFDDILSPTGKVLSTITVDKIHSSTFCDVTDTPITEEISDNEIDTLQNYGIYPKSVSDTIRTETYTNEDVLKIKLTPTLMDFDDFLVGRITPKDSHFKTDLDRCTPNSLNNMFYTTDVTVEERSVMPMEVFHEPNEYIIKTEVLSGDTSVNSSIKNCYETKQVEENNNTLPCKVTTLENYYNDNSESLKVDLPVKNKNDFYSKLCSIPAHYHAAILCFLLVAYNVLFHIYQQYQTSKVTKDKV